VAGITRVVGVTPGTPFVARAKANIALFTEDQNVKSRIELIAAMQRSMKLPIE